MQYDEKVPWALGKDGRRRLLLFLAKFSDFTNSPIAATLAWVCRSKGWAFDSYYDSYHEGVHFPGGDWRDLEVGKLTGGTVCADRHFEEFYHLVLRFDVAVVTAGESVFGPSLKRLNIPVVVESDKTSLIYRSVFARLEMPLSPTTVMIGANLDFALRGVEAYLGAEIWLREAKGVHETISNEELSNLCAPGDTIVCVCVHDSVIARLKEKGYSVEIIDKMAAGDGYLSITKRLARRWADSAKGWLLGDPALVCHWLPKACEDRLIPIYSIPQQRIIGELADLISTSGSVVYGRQYSDHDFFALSKLNQSLQVIDPCRPPFPSVRHLGSVWERRGNDEGFFLSEYSDEELRLFCREQRVLVSLLFWSGMIRELVNLYNLMDLIAATRLRCGLVLTSESFEYMLHPPMELLTIPVGDGGVFPLVEVLLGSCGAGVAIESAMDSDRLQTSLEDSLLAIRQKVANEGYVPRGWWGTMDTDLKRLRWWQKPGPVQFSRESPWIKLRVPSQDSSPDDSAIQGQRLLGWLRWLRAIGRASGLARFVAPLRPYEGFGPGPLKQEVVAAVKSAGFRYMFTKAEFNSSPRIQYMDEQIVALNYTSGRWDGWTPFETINSVWDLRRSEKKLLRSHRPGWIAGTIDTCQWTFGGEFWKRAPGLVEIGKFCSSGGDSGKLLNVKPFTLARYARIVAAEMGSVKRIEPDRSTNSRSGNTLSKRSTDGYK
jgi:hypothetical protein